MKKLFAAVAILGLVSAQAFAQTAPAEPTPAPVAPERMLDKPVFGGVTVGSAVVIGVAIAAIAVAASDSNSTTTHH